MSPLIYPARAPLDPLRPYGFFVEDECSRDLTVQSVATILLTNKECPWRCVMCDLWKNTLTETVPQGAIPGQIDYALNRLPPARHLKLYNSGSFFDRAAIPVNDYPAVAARANRFQHVIVESHPALIDGLCLKFRDLLECPLEVAMGLETAHPDILARLNKRMSLRQFSDAADFLLRHKMDLRVFVLVKPPFQPEHEAFEWAARSLDFAFDCGAAAVTLIPTRGGSGESAPPLPETVDRAFEYGLALRRGRVFLDLWNMHPESPRTRRLKAMNLRQTP